MDAPGPSLVGGESGIGPVPSADGAGRRSSTDPSPDGDGAGVWDTDAAGHRPIGSGSHLAIQWVRWCDWGANCNPRERFTVAVYGLVHAHAATLGDIGLNLQGSLRY